MSRGRRPPRVWRAARTVEQGSGSAVPARSAVASGLACRGAIDVSERIELRVSVFPQIAGLLCCGILLPFRALV
jgi:hypothetical protein